ncbi:MAG: nickel-dependent hydrogenase large subunit, partial [Coriobacteriia bacterium]
MANVWSFAGTSAATHEVDPVSRIEGHLGVKVVTDADGLILDANAHGNLWRGFENFLLGRAANDAITFVQRICGVCPVPHGMTSTYAVDNVFGYSRGHITFETDSNGYGVPAKAVLIRNLVLSTEFLMSSITHFYHLAAPSYIQGPAMPPWTPYFGNDNYHAGLLSTAHGSGAIPSGAGTQAM